MNNTKTPTIMVLVLILITILIIITTSTLITRIKSLETVKEEPLRVGPTGARVSISIVKPDTNTTSNTTTHEEHET